jgi:hypothetical protein
MMFRNDKAESPCHCFANTDVASLFVGQFISTKSTKNEPGLRLGQGVAYN